VSKPSGRFNSRSLILALVERIAIADSGPMAQLGVRCVRIVHLFGHAITSADATSIIGGGVSRALAGVLLCGLISKR
jgi:hypothetical protein